METLEDKVVLITGASRGIGRATAVAVAVAGGHVVAAARTESQLDALAGEIRTETDRPVLTFVADLAREDDVKRVVLATLAQWTRIDILVNNAGIRTSQAPLWQVSTEEWDEMMAVNLRGAFLCCHEVLPHMIERHSGHVIKSMHSQPTTHLPAP